MVSENIARCRRKAGLSQEDLAMRVHVVRQTVSKWENGRSLPDAEQVVAIAKALGVETGEILGLDEGHAPDTGGLEDQLALAEAELVRLRESIAAREAVGRARGLMLSLALAALLASVAVQAEIPRIVLVAVAVLAALVVLIRNVDLLSKTVGPSVDTDPIRFVAALSIVCVASMAMAGVLLELGALTVPGRQQELAAALLVGAALAVIGAVSPRIARNRHTGLRLPWTIADDASWRVAHRCLGVISIPMALVYIALSLWVPNFEALTLCVVLVWVGLPSLLSLRQYMKASHG